MVIILSVVTEKGGTQLSQTGLGGEFMIVDPGDMATIISPLIDD